MRFRVDVSFTLEHITLCHILGIFVSACLLLPFLIEAVSTEEEGTAPSPVPVDPLLRRGSFHWRYRVHRNAIGPIVMLSVLLCNYPGMVWQYQGENVIRYLNVFTLGMLCPLVYGYFFFLTPRRRQGVAFGASLFLGAVLAALILYIGNRAFGNGEVVNREQLHFFSLVTYVLIVLLVAVLTIAQIGGAFTIYRTPPLFLRDAELERRRTITLIIAAALIYSLINELNRVQYFPVIPTLSSDGYYLSVLYLFCPVVGWFLDRYPYSSFQPLIQLCAAIFMLTPVLLVTSPVSQAHWVVDLAVYMAMHAAYITIVVTLARLVRFGWRNFLALSLLYGLQVANNAMNGAIRNHLTHDPGLLVLFCILMVMLFYILVKNVNFTALPKTLGKTRVPDYSGVSFMEVANHRPQEQEAELYARLSAAEAVYPGGESGGDADTAVIAPPSGGAAKRPAAVETNDGTETTDLSDLIGAADPAEARNPTDTADAEELFLRKELTPRESAAALLIIKGLTNRDIAKIMGISEHTVANHVKQILRKFGVPSRKSLMAIFIGKGEEMAAGEKGTEVEKRPSSRVRLRENLGDAALGDGAV